MTRSGHKTEFVTKARLLMVLLFVSGLGAGYWLRLLTTPVVVIRMDYVHHVPQSQSGVERL